LSFSLPEIGRHSLVKLGDLSEKEIGANEVHVLETNSYFIGFVILGSVLRRYDGIADHHCCPQRNSSAQRHGAASSD